MHNRIVEICLNTMPDTPLQYPESYSHEDVQQILSLAIARHDDDEKLTRQQLWEIASELDIDLASIQAAETDWLEQKAIDRKRHAFNLHRRQKFKQRLVRYSIVNIFLVSLNLIAAGTLTWSLYILLFWGLGLTLNGWKAYQSEGDDYERAFQRWTRT